MAKKLIVITVVCALLIFPGISVFADTIGERSFTVDLSSDLPYFVSLNYGNGGSWLPISINSSYPMLISLSANDFGYTEFPSNSSGQRIAKKYRVGFVYHSIDQFEFTERYNLPSFDFPFTESQYFSLYYTCLFKFEHIYSASVDNDSIFTIHVSDSDSSLGIGNGFIVNSDISQVDGSYYLSFLVKFECPNLKISSSDKVISITSNFDFDLIPTADSNGSGRLEILSNVFPFVVSTNYDITDSFSSATYDAIISGVLPTIDNINQTMNNMSSAISAQAAQQSRAAASQMSQSAQQHSEEMAALSSLPQAQAEAQIDAAQSNAAAHVEAEMASEAAARESVSAQIPQYNSSVGGIEDFLNSVNTHLRTASFDFPALILPGMSGVYSGGTLSSSQHFSFDDLFSGDNPIVPPIILTLVQAICSIGLCCFLIRYIQKFVTQILGGTGNEGTV